MFEEEVSLDEVEKDVTDEDSVGHGSTTVLAISRISPLVANAQNVEYHASESET